MYSAMKLLALMSLLLGPLAMLAQDVQVAPTKGGIMLSVSAQHSYQLMPGETKLPSLSVECVHKGKHLGHLVLFSPGGMVASEGGLNSQGPQPLVLTANGKKLASSWVPFGDTDTYAYFAHSEEERVQFMESLLGSIVSIQFKPFLTGTPTTATFDLTKLREAGNKQPECSAQ
jgi:hypothetical protein